MTHTPLVHFEAAAAVEDAARRNHYEEEAVTGSFWTSAAASLPPRVRRRYARLFEAAEQYEPVVECIADACAGISRAIARIFSSDSKRRDVKRHGTLTRRHA